MSEQRHRGAEMQHHQEWQEAAALLVDRPAQQRRQHHGVAEAAHGEEFGHSLQNGHD
jgi:hypothetical protein